MSKIETEKTTKNTETMDDRQSIDKERQTHQKEYGGPRGEEPTRYGDWEKNGRCIDF
ncbi:MAG: DUF1674 domain-containing protein [Gammaproteobacteria bacterium]